MENEKLSDEIKKRLDELQAQRYQLFVVKQQDASTARGVILHHLTRNLAEKGLVVNPSLSAKIFREECKIWNLDIKKILYVTHEFGKEGKNHQVYYLEKTSSLVELSLVINDAINSEKYVFIFLDSLQQYLGTQFPEQVQHFLSFLISKASMYNTLLIATSIDSESSSQLIPYIQGLWNSTTMLLGQT